MDFIPEPVWIAAFQDVHLRRRIELVGHGQGFWQRVGGVQFDAVHLTAQRGPLLAVFGRERGYQLVPLDLQHILRVFGQAFLFVGAQLLFFGQSVGVLRFELSALRRRQFLLVRFFDRRDLIEDRFEFLLVSLDRRFVSLRLLFRGKSEVVVVRRREEGLQTI